MLRRYQLIPLNLSRADQLRWVGYAKQLLAQVTAPILRKVIYLEAEGIEIFLQVNANIGLYKAIIKGKDQERLRGFLWFIPYWESYFAGGETDNSKPFFEYEQTYLSSVLTNLGFYLRNNFVYYTRSPHYYQYPYYGITTEDAQGNSVILDGIYQPLLQSKRSPQDETVITHSKLRKSNLDCGNLYWLYNKGEGSQKQLSWYGYPSRHGNILYDNPEDYLTFWRGDYSLSGKSLWHRLKPMFFYGTTRIEVAQTFVRGVVLIKDKQEVNWFAILATDFSKDYVLFIKRGDALRDKKVDRFLNGNADSFEIDYNAIAAFGSVKVGVQVNGSVVTDRMDTPKIFSHGNSYFFNKSGLHGILVLPVMVDSLFRKRSSVVAKVIFTANSENEGGFTHTVTIDKSYFNKGSETRNESVMQTKWEPRPAAFDEDIVATESSNTTITRSYEMLIGAEYDDESNEKYAVMEISETINTNGAYNIDSGSSSHIDTQKTMRLIVNGKLMESFGYNSIEESSSSSSSAGTIGSTYFEINGRILLDLIYLDIVTRDCVITFNNSYVSGQRTFHWDNNRGGQSNLYKQTFTETRSGTLTLKRGDYLKNESFNQSRNGSFEQVMLSDRFADIETTQEDTVPPYLGGYSYSYTIPYSEAFFNRDLSDRVGGWFPFQYNFTDAPDRGCYFAAVNHLGEMLLSWDYDVDANAYPNTGNPIYYIYIATYGTIPQPDRSITKWQGFILFDKDNNVIDLSKELTLPPNGYGVNVRAIL